MNTENTHFRLVRSTKISSFLPNTVVIEYLNLIVTFSMLLVRDIHNYSSARLPFFVKHPLSLIWTLICQAINENGSSYSLFWLWVKLIILVRASWKQNAINKHKTLNSKWTQKYNKNKKKTSKKKEIEFWMKTNWIYRVKLKEKLLRKNYDPTDRCYKLTKLNEKWTNEKKTYMKWKQQI